MVDISIVKCDDYSSDNVHASLNKLLKINNSLDWVTPGMKIAIKANLVSFIKPELAATTHPTLLCELVKILIEKGAEVTVGDSPGGLYTSPYVNNVYSITGVTAIEEFGGKLNQNFEKTEAKFENGKALKEFFYTSYLDDVDAIINFSKLKTHAMMGMSAATKNMFGTIPRHIKARVPFQISKS